MTEYVFPKYPKIESLFAKNPYGRYCVPEIQDSMKHFELLEESTWLVTPKIVGEQIVLIISPSTGKICWFDRDGNPINNHISKLLAERIEGREEHIRHHLKILIAKEMAFLIGKENAAKLLLGGEIILYGEMFGGGIISSSVKTPNYGSNTGIAWFDLAYRQVTSNAGIFLTQLKSSEMVISYIQYKLLNLEFRESQTVPCSRIFRGLPDYYKCAGWLKDNKMGMEYFFDFNEYQAGAVFRELESPSPFGHLSRSGINRFSICRDDFPPIKE